MAINEALLPEFDNEAATTRRVLERVPEEKFDWKPHEKSFSMGDLASHVANLVSWTVLTINQDAFDMNPTGGEPVKSPGAKSSEELLATFDRNVAEARAALAAASDARLMEGWSLQSAGHTLFTMPKVAVLRSFVLNHLIHHRGQLSVYLRLNDIPVPSIYGPSADDSGGM